jgi:4-aminobutyrate aminotransferase
MLATATNPHDDPLERLPNSIPGPKARAILERDRAVVSHAYGRVADFVMAHGLGSQIYDVDGNRFIDFASGIAVNSTGHSHPHVVRAIQQQAEKFLHISSDFYHESWVRLSERLDEIAPFSETASVFRGQLGHRSGRGRDQAGALSHGAPLLYRLHGRLSRAHVGRAGLYRQQDDAAPRLHAHPRRDAHPLSLRISPVLAMQPGDADYGETVVNYLEKVIFKSILAPEDVAAVLVEPIQGEGGYVVPPASFFPRLREICDRHGILLIADEVQTGMGRTGKWWAIEHWGVEPDIVCTAKGIASGVPLGVPGEAQRWRRGRSARTATPTAATRWRWWPRWRRWKCWKMAASRTRRIRATTCWRGSTQMAARHPSMGDVRGKGLMIGVEFVHDKATKSADARLRNRIVELAFEHGLLIMGCGANSMRIIPPLVVERAEVDEGLDIFDYVIGLAENELL